MKSGGQGQKASAALCKRSKKQVAWALRNNGKKPMSEGSMMGQKARGKLRKR